MKLYNVKKMLRTKKFWLLYLPLAIFMYSVSIQIVSRTIESDETQRIRISIRDAKDSIADAEKIERELLADAEKKYGTRYEAESKAEQLIKAKLLSPSSADFSNVLTTFAPKTHRWWIRGDLDAQNSYGVKLRHSFNCVIEKSGDDWIQHLVNLAGR